MPKLKVFRTTIGFHDAYVAAPSRAAALRAWGSSTDLFAMDAAEEVTDPKLMKKPFADLGAVIKQSRGSEADHVAAASPKKVTGARVQNKPANPKPMPGRQKLDAADKRLADAEARFDRAKQEMDEEAARLAGRRRAMEHEQQSKISGLRDDRDRGEETYRSAADRWRAESE